MTDVRELHPVAPDVFDAIRRLHAAAEAHDRHPSLGAAVWRDLEGGGQPGSAGVFVRAGAELVGYAHVASSESSPPAHWAAGLVVHPAHRADGTVPELLAGVVEHVAHRGGGRVVLWILDPSGGDDARTVAAGFARSRDLLQMRVPLPPAEEPAWPNGVTVRTFVPGSDEAAWLAVNNRAFANHPEQGGWREATLRRREAEPWFDPEGFLLAFDTDGLAGFCWTKVHDTADPADRLGEIFVIGVDPSRQGTGLGRALVVAGLQSLATRGVPTGMLFVDAANDAAVGLYRALGFTPVRTDRAYELVVEST